ncbi:uncharacterized protein LOC108860388 [Raphanus sativus]|uniref:Uncharacterized protein LOC108860388 n=1 Tax=Raphanus sativus TaxID=3726 RepID=A0A6J0NZU3_RAPSA|nr:uncharacterized protein LOC108860388 [Raphanus sativus]
MECRKHKHEGNRGVCPSCLRDKLSRLPNTTPYYIINRFDSSSTSTTVSSSPSSSPPVKDHHRRAGSMSFAVSEALSGNLLMEGLKKSRSMAPRDSYIVTDSKKKETKKKSGFWKKLLHLRGKGGGGGGGGGDVGGLVTSRQPVF